jgi:hypothetical protein
LAWLVGAEGVKPLGLRACAELAQWGRPWCCYRTPLGTRVRGSAPHKKLSLSPRLVGAVFARRPGPGGGRREDGGPMSHESGELSQDRVRTPPRHRQDRPSSFRRFLWLCACMCYGGNCWSLESESEGGKAGATQGGWAHAVKTEIALPLPHRPSPSRHRVVIPSPPPPPPCILASPPTRCPFCVCCCCHQRLGTWQATLRLVLSLDQRHVLQADASPNGMCCKRMLVCLLRHGRHLASRD